MNTSKILLLDIENAPNLIWAWTTYETNAIEVEREWFLLSCAVKWLGRKGKVLALPDYPLYRKDPTNDSLLVKDIWKYLDEADIVMAHNGRKFDLRKINAKFFKWGLPPPSPYQLIDTLISSRANFDLVSHRLNEIAKLRKLGQKVEHDGWPLWKACINGDRKAWKRMRRYNLHDVILLERVYKDLRPWIKNHPHVVAQKKNPRCTRCGSDKVQSRGADMSGGKQYQRFLCTACGGWMRKLKKLSNA